MTATNRGKFAALVVWAAGLLAPAWALAEDQGARRDRYGDPLPPNALARLGTMRWRHPGLFFIAFGPGGKTLISGGRDGFFRVCETAGGRELRRFGQPALREPNSATPSPAAAPVLYSTAVLSPDRKTLAASSNNGTICLWAVATGRERCRIKMDRPVALAVLTFSPDGKRLLARGPDQRLHLFDAATGQDLRQFGLALRTTAGIGSATGFTRDGKTLITAGRVIEGRRPRMVLRVFEVATAHEVRQLELPPETLAVYAVAPDGRTVALVNRDGTACLWDVEANRATHRLGQAGQLRNPVMAFSPDGKTLAFRTGNLVRLWDVATGKESRVLGDKLEPAPPAASGVVYSASRTNLDFSPDGHRLATGGEADGMLIWDLAAGKQLVPVQGHQGIVSALAVSEDGRTVTTVGGDRTVRRWETTTGKEISRRALPPGATAVVLSTRGQTVAFGGPDAAVHWWDAATGKELGRFVRRQAGPGGLPAPAALVISPDGRTLAAVGADNVLRCWDTAAGEDLKPGGDNPRQGGPAAFGSVANLVFAPDGRTLALVAMDRAQMPPLPGAAPVKPLPAEPGPLPTIRLWDVTLGRETRRFDPHPGGVATLAFAPDGRTLASANYDGTISLWETATGRERLRINPDKSGGDVSLAVTAFSPDGRTLASGGQDRVVRLLDLATGRERARLTGHEGGILAVAFAPHGRALVSASTDGTALVWKVPAAAGDAPVGLNARRAEGLWSDLCGRDAAKAYKASCTLRAGGSETVALLRERLRPAAATPARPVIAWITDLDSDRFEVRQKAFRELENLGEAAEPALRKALAGNPSPEVRQRVEDLLAKRDRGATAPQQVEGVRAVEVLEHIGTPEARQVLKELGNGNPDALLTREARAALERLSRETAATP